MSHAQALPSTRSGHRVVQHLRRSLSGLPSRETHSNDDDEDTRSAQTSTAPVNNAISTGNTGGMDDEYGDMTELGTTCTFPSFTVENGTTLKEVPCNYATFGQLNQARDNAVVVCHALTGNARLDSWWPGLLGPGRPFDTSRYFVVCANILGSCYGTCGPTSIDPRSGRRYAGSFPLVTVRDTVRLHLKLLQEELGVRSVKAVVGGSLGGMQALEWLILGGSFVRSGAVMACGAAHTPWQIAISECQRQAIYADPKWQNGNYDPASPPASGLSVARQMAMVSYRTPGAYVGKFGRELLAKDANDSRLPQGLWPQPNDRIGHNQAKFQVESYLHYQGKKFLSRFDAASYVTVTKQMDMHDVGRGRGGVAAALASIAQPVLLFGIDSDMLYPIEEQHQLNHLIPNSQMAVISSEHGHDGFLLEQDQIAPRLTSFLNGVA